MKLTERLGAGALFALAWGAAGGTPPGLAGDPAQVHGVVMGEYYFVPNSVVLQPGETVEWRNTGMIAHTTTSDGPLEWESEAMQPGATFSLTFEEPGVYPYYCRLHPQIMEAEIVVEGEAPSPTPTSTTPPSATPTPTETSASPTPTDTQTAEPPPQVWLIYLPAARTTDTS
jgi:plastocyanin